LLQDSITWALRVRLTWAFVSAMAYVGLKQSITIEPVVRFLELLLYSKTYSHTHCGSGEPRP
jgi:hypothetical protein